MTHPAFLIFFGVVVGVFSGFMGLGGGALMVPLLAIVFELTQQQAQGTSLAVLLAPGSLPALWRYHMAGNIEWRLAAWMIGGFFLGSFFGADLAQRLKPDHLKIAFGFVLVFIAAYQVFSVGSHYIRGVSVGAGAVVLLIVLRQVFAAIDVAAKPS